MTEPQLGFLKDIPQGIYRTTLTATLDENREIPADIVSSFRSTLSRLKGNPQDGFIETPDEFFARWIHLRKKTQPRLPQQGEGFELYLPQVRIQEWDDGEWCGRVESILLAADFGYSGDFRNNLVFLVNHLPSRRALTYRDRDATEFTKNPLGEKVLQQKPIYRWSDAPSQFPLRSVNITKSSEQSYTLINIDPDEVYRALERIGFRFESPIRTCDSGGQTKVS